MWLCHLLVQFLIKFLPELTGRDLPFAIVLELNAYNLAYMATLSVPMAALLTSRLVFGSLAESRTCGGYTELWFYAVGADLAGICCSHPPHLGHAML